MSVISADYVIQVSKSPDMGEKADSRKLRNIFQSRVS